jgi:hypothetical protein
LNEASPRDREPRGLYESESHATETSELPRCLIEIAPAHNASSLFRAVSTASSRSSAATPEARYESPPPPPYRPPENKRSTGAGDSKSADKSRVDSLRISRASVDLLGGSPAFNSRHIDRVTAAKIVDCEIGSGGTIVTSADNVICEVLRRGWRRS